MKRSIGHTYGTSLLPRLGTFLTLTSLSFMTANAIFVPPLSSFIPSLTLPKGDLDLNVLDYTDRSTVGRRQGSAGGVTPPPPCTSICAPVLPLLGAACPTEECCNEQFDLSFFACLVCVGEANENPDFGPAQAQLDQLTQQCAAQSAPIAPLTIPSASLSSVIESAIANSLGPLTASTDSVLPTSILTQLPISSGSLSSPSMASATSVGASSTSPSISSPSTAASPAPSSWAVESRKVGWSLMCTLVVGWVVM
ncbi:hypothetical protein BDN72DRAFT_551801 [Pluteus cervinus]|uniref:Uncharacterized protein n=1 Tax=Pluteus cervinus TaxID=181527 RepID=A0ACD3AX00_9AGAR|nr:hypothetical protein BDN72DRAFT_551801 [Pluteus cervinus]